MSKKVKTLTEEAVISKVINNSKYSVNPKYFYDPNRDRLTKFMQNLDSVQACGRFKWVNTPKSIPAFRIEQMLYNRGALVFFKQGNQFRLLPFYPNSELNCYGLLKEVTPIAYNGIAIRSEENNGKNATNFAQSLIVANYGTDENIEGKAVILFDRVNAYVTSGGIEPIAIHQMEAIEQIVNRLCVLNVNLINSQGKNLIIVKDPKQASAVDKNLSELYKTDNPYSVAKANYDIQVVNNTIEYKEQQIWEDIMSWNNWRLANIGIQNSGLFNKKERQLTSEVDIQNEQVDLVLQEFYNSRKEFIEQIRQVFGKDKDFQEQCLDFDVELVSQNVSRETNKEQNPKQEDMKDDINNEI